MNNGLEGFPAHRPEPGRPGVRAMVVFDGSAPAGGAGFQIESQAFKARHNVAKIVYNGTGDYTVHFADPFETQYFVPMGMAKNNGVNTTFFEIHASDLGLATQKRLRVMDTSGTSRNSTEVCLAFLG